MPALEQDVVKRRKPLPSDLTDLDRLLLERQDEGFDRLEASVNRLIERTPNPRLILATASSIILGVFALVFYLVTLLAKGQGIDTGAAIRETREIIEVVAPVAAPPAPTPAPVTDEVDDG